MAARNKAAAARGARTRELIRQLLLEHSRAHPLGRQLTAKQIQWHLKGRGVYLAPSTVAWHVNRIRLAADLEALDAELRWNPSNLSDTTPTL